MGRKEKKKLDSEDDVSDEKQKEEDEPIKKVPLLQLFRYATGGEKLLLLLGCIIALITGSGLPLMSILQGRATQSFVDEQTYKIGLWNVTHPNQTYDEGVFKHDVMAVVYGYAGMTVGIFISAGIQVSLFLYVCEQMSNRLRRQFVRAILRQDIPWFDKNNGGTLASKLFDNLERVKEGTGDKIGLMFQYISQFLTGFGVAFFHSWKLTLVMMAMTPLQAFCGFAISKSMSTFTQTETKKYAKAGKVVEQAISSIRTVVSLNGLPFEINKYKEAVHEARRAGVLKNLAVGCSFGLMGFTNFASFALSFYIGVGWVHDGNLTVQNLLTTFFSVMMGSLALGQAGPQFAVLGAAQGAAASIFEVLDREPEIDSSSTEGHKGAPLKGRIEVKSVHFNYPSRPEVNVLNGLSLDVAAGETVALVGSSGCGKSTIVSLLLRYYNLQQGVITIDGIPINDMNIEYLRNQIAVVSQEPILFNCSIEDNIKFGRADLTHDEMVHACNMSNASKFISGLPNGYQTLVGDRGTQLSGGQKQRIAIARALVRDPKILLLDEATSALDTESEAIVQEALNKASKGRTTLIIAHRLSTIKHADKIISIKGGEVAEMGSHDELMAKKGLYYDLVTAQSFTDAVDGFSQGRPAADRQFSRLISQASTAYSRSTSYQDRRASLVEDALGRMRSASGMTMEMEMIPAQAEIHEKKDDITRLKKELQDEGLDGTNLYEIFRNARNQWPTLFFGISVSILAGLVFPTYSVFFTQVIQVFTDPTTELTKGHFWALMFLVLAGVQAFCLFNETFWMGISAEYLCADLRNKLFRTVLSQDMGYFDSPKHACGKICTRLAMDVPNLKTAIDFRLSTVIATFISLAGGIGIAFYNGWRMACLVVGILPLLGLGHTLRARVWTGKHRKSAKDFEDSGKVAMEAIENVRTVQALTRENKFYDLFCMHLDAPHKEATNEAIVQGISYGFASCVVFLLNCCAYRLGLYLILTNRMLPIKVLRVMYAIAMSATTLGFATAYFPEYMKAKFAGGIIFGMLSERSAINNLTEDGKREELTGAVTFKNVRFSYPERPEIEILKGLSFTVQPGHTLALVGPSGCGKSTTVGLIERFYDVKGGQVLLDSHDIRTLNPHYTRAQIAVVSQEPILFDCSIKDNIVYGMPGDITMSKVEEAAQKANIHAFIAKLPDGYDTRVGDKGTQLSGGQKQRIAIARALIRDPKILLLDEATSALDTESEKVVQEALDRAREGRTCIVIAHRLSTVINADSIAVVKAGEIVEQGSHNELMAKKGAYYELTQRQVMKTTPQ